MESVVLRYTVHREAETGCPRGAFVLGMRKKMRKGHTLTLVFSDSITTMGRMAMEQ